MMQEALAGAILNWAGISKGFLTGLLGMKERQASIHCSTACGANTGFKGRGTAERSLSKQVYSKKELLHQPRMQEKGQGNRGEDSTNFIPVHLYRRGGLH